MDQRTTEFRRSMIPYEDAAWMVKHGAYARTAEDLQRVIDARHAEIIIDAYASALRDVGIPEFVLEAISKADAQEAHALLKIHLATVKHCAEKAANKDDEKADSNKNTLTAEEAAWVRSGKPIEAIKSVRLRLDIGLKEAKDIVDAARAAMNRGNGQ